MRRDITHWGIRAALTVMVVAGAVVATGCHSSSGAGAQGGNSGGTSSNLDTAKAVEVQVTKASGGIAHVETAKGGVDIYIPPGAVSSNMQLVITPLLKPEPATGGSLNAGVSVVQKGHEGQHIALGLPAFVSFTFPGKIDPKVVVVGYSADASGAAYGTSVVTTGGVSTVTAAVPGFTIYRVELDRERVREKLRKRLPKFKYGLQITGTVPNEKGPLRWFTKANGYLTSSDMMSDLKGDIEFDIEVWVHMAGAWGKGGTSRIYTNAVINQTSYRTVNAQAGSFVSAGYGTAHVTGSVAERGTVEAEGISAGFAKNAAGNGEFPIVVTTTSYPAAGRPVPAKVSIWIGGRRYDYTGTLKSLGIVSWYDSQ